MPKRKTRSSTKAKEHAQDEEPKDETEDSGNEQPTVPSKEQSPDQDVHHYAIPFKTDKQISCERRSLNNEHSSSPSLIFTHGAGGGISAPSTADFASGFATVASVVCYQGSMNLTNRVKYFHTVLEHEKAGGSANSISLGGRSMGARAAVLTALEQYEAASDEDEERPTKVLVLVSYPLLAGGTTREPERREKILVDLPEDVDVLFVVGGADGYCPLDMLEEVRNKMAARSWVCVVESADHGMSMKPKKASEDMRRKTGEVAAKWLEGRDEGRRWSGIKCDHDGEIVFEGWEDEVGVERKEKKLKT